VKFPYNRAVVFGTPRVRKSIRALFLRRMLPSWSYWDIKAFPEEPVPLVLINGSSCISCRFSLDTPMVPQFK
jgi:hypothetical protein